MDGDLKGDFVNSGFAKGRISGLTRSPTREDLELGFEVLEDMMQEYFGHNINVNYTFEDDPDPNTPHNVDRKYWNPIKSCLAVRLLTNYGKEPLAGLVNQASGGFSFLSSSTAPVRETQYPSRQPIGSGNTRRWSRWYNFYPPIEEAPLSAGTNHMVIGDIDDFVEHFDSWLVDPETVASYTIEADESLTIVSDSLTTPDVFYQIEATGSSSETSSEVAQVKIVATSSDGRITTRLIQFDLVKVEI